MDFLSRGDWQCTVLGVIKSDSLQCVMMAFSLIEGPTILASNSWMYGVDA